MVPNVTTPPGAPTRRGTAATDGETFKTRLGFLCNEWDLGLDIGKNTSPVKGDRPIDEKCVSLLSLCFYHGYYDEAYEKFDVDARKIYNKWVLKPRAERGTIPSVSRRQKRPVNAQEREELLQCLFKILLSCRDKYLKNPPGTPKSIKDKLEKYCFDLEKVDKVPIAGVLSPSPRVNSEKRPREESFADIPSTKKTKETKEPELPTHQSSSRMGPPRGRPRVQESRLSRSANTSFASTVPSVFSQKEQGSSFPATQSTASDGGFEENGAAFTTLQDDKCISSDYQSSSFEKHVADVPEDEYLNDCGVATPAETTEEELSQGLMGFALENESMAEELLSDDQLEAESQFKELLEGIFPKLPRCLKHALPCVVYEITRVFLHADVPISKLHAPITAGLADYGTLWRFLRSLPVLKDKSFPERSSKEAWACALESYDKGFLAVALGGSLHFSSDDGDRFFRLRLDPLKVELSHRLGRRFGHDRFLDICIPQLYGRHIPATLSLLGERGPRIIYEWLVDADHQLLGRHWKPFMVKDKERKARKRSVITQELEEVDTSFRLFFFATEGQGFLNNDDLISHPNPAIGRPKISIPILLRCVRPIEGNMKNVEQPYLKLFNRTTLALSRNIATIVLLPSQIRLMESDIIFGGDPKNVMNDGAGRISPTLALKVTQKLGLSYLPTAFQGRIGEAKGLWIIDRHAKGGEDWIETYPSQRKWHQGKGSDDASHRTFEVLKCSGPLKSADLNLQFLPLLMDRAKDKEQMKKAISDVLEEGLGSKVEEIKAAMDDPRSFRKWVRDCNPNVKERLKGGISYKSGLPSVREERLNFLLDAGFDPRKSRFLKEMAKEAFKSRTDELKEKLNITVGRSTYAYMVPDFWGVLEAGEVYIDFSSFVDNVSGFSGATLSGDEILVARSPAHFVSDIQKVKTVIKAELVGLKDVIVFSVKGKPSLADKLSGGDYDGDIAWVCWEPSIVNFETAEVPPTKDLVKEGLLRQDKTTYKQLVAGLNDHEATSKFLKKSFEFNMQQSLLGVCTVFKENVCYTLGNVDTEESRYLSQLLSNLVDQPKQGYIFGEDDWKAFKEKKIHTKPWKPRYKTEKPMKNAEHIIDHLKYVAEKTVDKALQGFHDTFPDPPFWDADLAAYYFKFADLAAGSNEWKRLLDDMKSDIMELKIIWMKKFQRSFNGRRSKNPNIDDDDESVPDFHVFANDLFEKFREIQPRQETPISQALMMTPGSNTELSSWELLKASAAVAAYADFKKPHNAWRLYVSNFVWWMGGKQLAKLKAMCSGDVPHSVIPSMYIVQKPDPPLIRRLRSEGQATNLEDAASIANEADLDAADDD